MTPEKTGAQIWLEEYQAWAICDAFKLHEGQYLFRIAGVSHGARLRQRNHYIVGRIEHWWQDHPIQTMIATEVEYLGYDGVLV